MLHRLKNIFSTNNKAGELIRFCSKCNVWEKWLLKIHQLPFIAAKWKRSIQILYITMQKISIWQEWRWQDKLETTYFSLWKYRSRSSSFDGDNLQSYGAAIMALASIPNSMHHLIHSFHTDERGPEQEPSEDIVTRIIKSTT